MSYHSPHRYFQLQFDVEPFPNPGANKVDQPRDIASAGARIGDDEIAIAFAYFRAADTRFGECRPVDELGRSLAARILEDPSGGLKAQRLGRLPLNPGLEHPTVDSGRIIGFQL